MTEFMVLYTLVSGLVGIWFDYFINTFDILVRNIREMSGNEVLMKVITGLLWVKTQFDMTAAHMYNTYPVVRENTDKVCYAVDFCMATIYGYNIEPFGNNWISVTTMYENNTQLFLGSNYSYSERYYHLNTEQTADLSVNDYHKQCLKYVCDTVKSRCSADVVETMIMMKVSDKYLYTSYFNLENVVTGECTMPVTAGRKMLLSIEYTHPMMKTGIVMDIPSSMYCKSNIILTPVFIKRYLEYQDKPFVFDMNYVLKIMDTNINTFTLRCNQCVKLTNFSYDIITLYNIEIEPVNQTDSSDVTNIADDDVSIASDNSSEEETNDEDVSQNEPTSDKPTRENIADLDVDPSEENTKEEDFSKNNQKEQENINTSIETMDHLENHLTIPKDMYEIKLYA